MGEVSIRLYLLGRESVFVARGVLACICQLIVFVFLKIGANHDQPLFGRCGCVCLYLYYMLASKCVCVRQTQFACIC